MAAAIEREFGLGSDLIPGSGGIFEVVLDGRNVFTNGSCGGVPVDEEVLAALRPHVA